MLTVFARKEPTTDTATRDMLKALGRPESDMKHRQDVCIYRDEACQDFFCRFSWHNSNKPRRSQKKVTINCFNWDLKWVN